MGNKIISVKELKKLLTYNHVDGKIFWRTRTPDMFTDGKYSAERVCQTWNGRHAGKEALCGFGGHGYKQGRIYYRKYLAQRVAFALYYGHWPNSIDHINHDKSDNRIKNLRDVVQIENCRNMSFSKKNTSGTCGVSWHKINKKWTAQIRVMGKQKFLGIFKERDQAISARAKANKKYGYQENHGQDL